MYVYDVVALPYYILCDTVRNGLLFLHFSRVTGDHLIRSSFQWYSLDGAFRPIREGPWYLRPKAQGTDLSSTRHTHRGLQEDYT